MDPALMTIMEIHDHASEKGERRRHNSRSRSKKRKSQQKTSKTSRPAKVARRSRQVQDVEKQPIQKKLTRYGISISSDQHVKQRMKIRKKYFHYRQVFGDFSVFFAALGIFIAVVEAEVTANYVTTKKDFVSIFLRSLTLISTVVLLILLVCYHAVEVQISAIDSGADDWRVAISWDRIQQIAVELFVCAICPLPWTRDFSWPFIENPSEQNLIWKPLPVDVILSVPMFLRSYLLGRLMVLHSKQFQDAATRSIAALNRITVNFAFVLKTQMAYHPLTVILMFTVAYWICVAWMLNQCDRYYYTDGQLRHSYLNSLWLIIVTFMSIGYGDVVPYTYCGRAVAILTGIVGAGVSAALIAVMSKKLELTRAEKHVNNFISDSKLTQARKNAAASVLQQTWLIHKYKVVGREEIKVRQHQRRFLQAINDFRKVKWDQRKLAEQGMDLMDIGKVHTDIHESIADMQRTQDFLVTQVEALSSHILTLQQTVQSLHTLPLQTQPRGSLMTGGDYRLQAPSLANSVSAHTMTSEIEGCSTKLSTLPGRITSTSGLDPSHINLPPPGSVEAQGRLTPLSVLDPLQHRLARDSYTLSVDEESRFGGSTSAGYDSDTSLVANGTSPNTKREVRFTRTHSANAKMD